MGCNVSKDVKVEDQGNVENAINGSSLDRAEMSEEKAAEKIQASFRGYKTRKTLKDNGVKTRSNGDIDEKTEELPEESTDPDELLDIDLNDAELEKAATKIQASYRNFTSKKKQRQTQQEAITENEEPEMKEEELDLDLNDEELEKAAVKIQASYRNFTSKKKQRQTQQEAITENEEPEVKEDEENLEDIDLEDPDLGKAALKIQSTFRGYKVRKEIPIANGERGDDE